MKDTRSLSNPGGERPGLIDSACKVAVAGCLALAIFRLWSCVCFFPVQEWNDVRLRATYLIIDGLPLYPGLNAGLITTWIYGPVLPLLMLPTTLARTYDAALLTAAAWNALLLVGALGFACLAWPAPTATRWSGTARLCALGVSLLLLPRTFFIFLQADNAALACGLVSLTCLARAARQERKLWWWLAAGFAGAAVFSKLHGVALLLGEIGWLWFAGSRRQARQHGLRLLLVCGIWTLVTLAVAASPLAAWDQMVRIPSRLPFTREWSARLRELAPYLALMVALPGIFAVCALPRYRPWASDLGLPVCAWLLSLPLGLAGALTIGGWHNSLHGAFFLLPITLVEIFSRHLPAPHPRNRLASGVTLAGLMLLLVFQGMNLAELPHRPLMDIPDEAVAISARLGSNVWLPWRPLATRFATGRHDHDEDGLYVRQLTALFPRHGHALACLPPAWDCTVFQVVGMNWHIADTMLEGGSIRQESGRWLVVTRPATDSGIGKVPVKGHPLP